MGAVSQDFLVSHNFLEKLQEEMVANYSSPCTIGPKSRISGRSPSPVDLGDLPGSIDPKGPKFWLPSQITTGLRSNNKCSPMNDQSVKYIPSHPDL